MDRRSRSHDVGPCITLHVFLIQQLAVTIWFEPLDRRHSFRHALPGSDCSWSHALLPHIPSLRSLPPPPPAPFAPSFCYSNINGCMLTSPLNSISVVSSPIPDTKLIAHTIRQRSEFLIDHPVQYS